MRGLCGAVFLLFLGLAPLGAQAPATASGAQAPATAPGQRYSVLMLGKIAGEEMLFEREGEQRAHFKYNDRGRGPDLTCLLYTSDAADE